MIVVATQYFPKTADGWTESCYWKWREKLGYGTALHSQHEKCQKKKPKNAEVVYIDHTADCWVKDVENDCAAGEMMWTFDLEKLRRWGTFQVVIGIVVLVFEICLCCWIFVREMKG